MLDSDFDFDDFNKVKNIDELKEMMDGVIIESQSFAMYETTTFLVFIKNKIIHQLKLEDSKNLLLEFKTIFRNIIEYRGSDYILNEYRGKNKEDQVTYYDEVIMMKKGK